ncbi:MAG: ABC transporter substrate-binding protein [Ignavibacteriaceae bacterium]|nr:ABC transporter substrate-binding protein [Ignavibacteriaceae bacterium]
MLRKIIISIILYAFTIQAQSADEINKKFTDAVRDFQQKKWTEALSTFSNLADSQPVHSKTTLSILFEAKTNLELGNYSQAEKRLIKLVNDFPTSIYSDEALLTLSKIFYLRQQYLESYEKLCQIIIGSSDSAYIYNARKISERLAFEYLNSDQLKTLHDTTKVTLSRPNILLMLGKLLLHRKNVQAAKEYFRNLINLYPQSYEAYSANELINNIAISTTSNANAALIGVLLPLAKNLPSYGTASEILEGIKYCLSEFNKEHYDKIGLLIRDTELKTDKLVEIETEFAELNNLKCIVGPMYSAEVKDVLKIFSSTNLPIISPTATEDYLTNISENFFQANPSFIYRGRLMAQYVYFVENKRRIAIVNAIDGYSPILSSSFSQEFERLGGRIYQRESYKSGKINFKDLIAKLTSVFNQIDGLYFPLADRTDIPAILSLLSQINLDIPVYGDQDWMNLLGFESTPFLNNQLIFCSDYFIDFNDQEYQNFSKNFFSVTKKDVNRNVLYGYDVMKYLLNILRNSFSGSEAIIQKMKNGYLSFGIHNNLCFDSNRINLYLNIIRFTNGKFELIDKYRLNN